MNSTLDFPAIIFCIAQVSLAKSLQSPSHSNLLVLKTHKKAWAEGKLFTKTDWQQRYSK